MEFNELQQKIINSIQGAYLISAPVGTGKTTVLTERIVKAIEQGIKPEEVLALTFTNRASEEMKERIKKRINNKDVSDQIIIKTFHGFCAYLVKAEAKRLGISPDFVIFDEDEQLDIMKTILQEHPDLIDLNTENHNREIFNLLENLYKHRLNIFMKDVGCQVSDFAIDKDLKQVGEKYLKILNDQNALDFNELVMLSLEILYKDEELKNKWSDKFKFIQLDEFQDTHISEYLVVKQLARKHKNLSFIGDLDQTIYSWRGSEPKLVASWFKSHFAPVTELHLEINYRFNPNILEAVKSFLSNLEDRQTKNMVGVSQWDALTDDKCIKIFGAYNFPEEVNWVIDNIKQIKKDNPDAKIAVFSRANYLIKDAARIFTKNNISHITVDKYDFFRRQEVRDIFAYLKIIFNKFDLESACRLVLRPARNIGLATLKTIRDEGSEIGIKVSDFLTLENYNFSEPFVNLIKNWEEGRVVVLDTETTGTNTLSDEIVQIYAREVVNGKVGEEFHYYIKNKKPVGNSYEVHKLTDEFLQKEGKDIKKVLQDLKKFIGSSALSGHNVNFDLAMLRENGKRNDVVFDFKEYYDTLDIAKRLIISENYKLNTLAQKLKLETATHSADDDVMATVGLLEVLVKKLKPGHEKRTELFNKFSKKFILIATLINDWQKVIKEKRAPIALQYIWEKSGLAEYYQEDKDSQQRLESFNTLLSFFEKRDDASDDPEMVMQELIRYPSLVKNLDFLGLDQGKIPIITVHQAKGLEFDYVFIMGVNEYKFPLYKSDLEEEKRLFYVALTRARKKIFISYSNNDQYNRSMARSRFVDFIDKRFVDVV